ncbi:MAG: isoleucine--tRNA ligase [Bacteroidia bacterium]|nr:MAG: isoleucine--tRNA ligase [Bacteroidia bacterium]
MSKIQTQIYPTQKQFSIPEIEKQVLDYWKAYHIFEESISQREGCPNFNFYEGPPSANGFPGIHHVMSRTLKDLFCRYKTIKGFKVNRKAGWDTHGLPVELQVEKKLGITKEDIGKKISIEEYNRACREDVLKFKDKWDELTERMGYWVDLKNPYITFDNHYIESVWYILKNFHERNLLYKGYTIQPYSPAAGTGLSSHELNLPGCYKIVKDTSCVAQFLVKGTENTFFLAWTTTPWTLPANSALAVGKNIIYLKIQTFNPYTHLPIIVILAKDRLSTYFSKEGENQDLNSYQAGQKIIPYKILEEIQGKDLEGLSYEPLFEDWANAYPEKAQKAFRVIIGDFVTTEEGTGIVHIAPTFGADDMRVAQQNDIPAVLFDGEPIVDKQGKYIPHIRLFANRYVKDYTNDPHYKSLDVDICIYLKQNNRAFKVEKYEHNYPHCWRTDKPILYYPLESWFVRTTALKERLVELNQTIRWKPTSVGTGRFGNWLENLVDWNLSRSRYWGIPLPIWTAEDNTTIAIGSIQELKNYGYLLTNFDLLNSLKDTQTLQQALHNGTLKKVSELPDNQIDLHKPFIDQILIIPDIKNPKIYIREKDLIDVWFDSGAMPYAQVHYPFENQENFDKVFPADFIAEGIDQTRGWFFTLHAISTLFKDSIAFKNVIANGLLLDKNGIKMSKRLGNVIDPFETLEKYGADPTRWYMMENTPPWENLKFNLEALQETIRKFFGTLFNTYNFFALYANLDGFVAHQYECVPYHKRTELDQWIISLLNSLIKKVETALEDYDPTTAARAIQEFVIDQLSNWYVRLSRKRFWKGEMNQDKIAAYQTLHECLLKISQLISPIAPFTAEWLYKSLTYSSWEDKNSVHIALFPKANKELIQEDLEEQMAIAQKVCSLVHSIRKKHQLRVRLPLSKLLVPAQDEKMKTALLKAKDLILSEVNIKELIIPNEEDTTIIKKIKPNFKLLGPKLGSQLKFAQSAIEALSQEDIKKLEKGSSLNIQIGELVYELLPNEVEIFNQDIPGWAVVSEHSITVAIDLQVTKALENEGIARDFVNRIQNLRKDLDFDVTDTILIQIQHQEEWKEAIEEWKNYIQTETLAKTIEWVHSLENGHEIEVNNIIGKTIIIKS